MYIIQATCRRFGIINVDYMQLKINIGPQGKRMYKLSRDIEVNKNANNVIYVTLECCADVGVIGGVSSKSRLAAFGNRCSCTDAKLN